MDLLYEAMVRAHGNRPIVASIAGTLRGTVTASTYGSS